MFSKIFKKQNNAYMIAGLGNPEKKYDGTRHNIGFEVIDRLSKEYDIPLTTMKYRGMIGKGMIGGKKIMLVKPFTYMNNSGECVGKLADYEKIDAANVLIICDDINLGCGKLRLRKKGSDGGHNGLKSIEQHLRTSEYPRLRIGVGNVPKEMSQVDFVLGHFSYEDKKNLEEPLNKIVKEIPGFIDQGIEYAMNRLNG